MLVGTSHPGNVGAAARAMRAMGLRRLVLAAPRDPQVCAHPEAIARASRAHDVLAAARIVPSLTQALADRTLAIAVSAETREFGPLAQTPEACVQLARDELAADTAHRVSFVFGAERTGLSIEEVGLCQALCSIPGETDYQSLNLAQAVQVIAYCLRAQAAATPATPATAGTPAPGTATAAPSSPHATQAQVEALYVHLERALTGIGFLDPRRPKKLMPRLRRLFARARLETEEVAILRGICTRIERLTRASR
ncbi:MAG: TrmJ/YjtD family RNA methyltransferase [Burkholderiaceae bacterium]|nr:TrmJ/YjtD family RNA methyltransferase [Burkholderiaceae bacterium]